MNGLGVPIRRPRYRAPKGAANQLLTSWNGIYPKWRTSSLVLWSDTSLCGTRLAPEGSD